MKEFSASLCIFHIFPRGLFNFKINVKRKMNNFSFLFQIIKLHRTIFHLKKHKKKIHRCIFAWSVARNLERASRRNVFVTRSKECFFFGHSSVCKNVLSRACDLQRPSWYTKSTYSEAVQGNRFHAEIYAFLCVWVCNEEVKRVGGKMRVACDISREVFSRKKESHHETITGDNTTKGNNGFCPRMYRTGLRTSTIRARIHFLFRRRGSFFSYFSIFFLLTTMRRGAFAIEWRKKSYRYTRIRLF